MGTSNFSRAEAGEGKMTDDECGMTKETRMTSNDVRRNFVIRHSSFPSPPATAFAPAGS